MNTLNPNIAIVLPCYNRVDTLSILLKSLLQAKYSQKVNIVFSIDYSGSDNVYKLAKSLEWPYGEKIIIKHDTNIGLRKNIISCGDLTNQYDAVIVLEDDLVVSPYFFDYAVNACRYYWDEERVAEISLYSYQVSEGLNYFSPLTRGYDTYFMQWSSSWGQLWTARQWKDFKKWYDNYNGDLKETLIPNHVKSWKESWKKFHIAYMVEKDKYCVYPVQSYTTTVPTLGTHSEAVKYYSPLFVPLYENKIRNYLFQPYECALKYDSFFELKVIEIEYNNDIVKVDFDLYGDKERCHLRNQFYITTIENKQSQCLKKWGRLLLPFEKNVLNNLSGDGLYMYKVSDYTPINMSPTEKKDRRMYLTSSENLKLVIGCILKKINHLFECIYQFTK